MEESRKFGVSTFVQFTYVSFFFLLVLNDTQTFYFGLVELIDS